MIVYKNGKPVEYAGDKLAEIATKIEEHKRNAPAPDPMQERMEKQERKLDSIEGLCNSILSLLRGGR